MDGSTLPAAPWVFYQAGGTEGETVVAPFLDPETGATNQALRINSGTNSTEWYVGPVLLDEIVAAARFKTVSFSGTGSENLLCVNVGGSMDPAASPAITIVTNRYKVWSYTEGAFGSGVGGSQILDIGPVIADELHTAYIYAHKNGTTKVVWDGQLIFDGIAPSAGAFDGYIEWGSGSWQYKATTTIDFDWVGYGGVSDFPWALNIARDGNNVVLSWPTNATGFILQFKDNLSAPTWTNTTNNVGIVGAQYTVTNDLAQTSRFYRLFSPLPLLRPASQVQFPHATDSNSPAHWDGTRLYLFNSTGHPYRSYGSNLFALGNTAAVAFNNTVNGGRWMEATWRAGDGTLYGWYHLEPGGLCPGLTAPKIGAVRSTNNGANWTDLGVVLEARPGTLRCDAQNGYFAGGNGDFSVMLDAAEQYLYLFISTYAGDVSEQGVAVARMAWSDRDTPAGKVWKWYNGAWEGAGLGGNVTPILPATVAWERADCEAFWGPSIHWNTHLQQYVMLLNRAKGSGWIQEGIYISVTSDLANPLSWSQPQKILNGGNWYPQVIGLGANGTDKLAGQVARFFMGGVSNFEIVFPDR